MPTEISIRGSDLNPSSRAFHWPVLEAGNRSYQDGVYSVVFEEKEREGHSRYCIKFRQPH